MKIKKKKRLNGKEEVQITPFVKSLGIEVNLEADFDYKEEYTKYLIEKYK